MIATSKDHLEEEGDFEEFVKTHDLIMELFEHVPSLLLNVVPQLEEELKVENSTIRQIASNTLGTMFSKRGSKWVDSYPHIFKTWCDRRNDKNALIRMDWAEMAGSIVKNHPDLTQVMEREFFGSLLS